MNKINKEFYNLKTKKEFENEFDNFKKGKFLG